MFKIIILAIFVASSLAVETDVISDDVVTLKLCYESLCPASKNFYTTKFNKTVQDFKEHLIIYTYPFGIAVTTDLGNGTYSIRCQHGVRECYGNMLHACALDYFGSQNVGGIFFNSCLMNEWRSKLNPGSDDAAADKCGEIMNIDSKPIKECAKSPRGRDLLKKHGEESEKINYEFVPYLLINDNFYDSTMDLEKEICKTFRNPPPRCNEKIKIDG